MPAIRQRFGRKVQIIVRGDASFAREPIMSHCEVAGLFYCFGLARNDRLQAQLEEEFERLQQQIDQGALQAPCRSFMEFEYATLQSWSRARRVIGKAEILSKGANPRFIVTNLPAEAFKDQSLSGDNLWLFPKGNKPFIHGRSIRGDLAPSVVMAT